MQGFVECETSKLERLEGAQTSAEDITGMSAL
jgi:hypothetical protein